MVSTRLNIALAVKVVSRFMSNPMKEHWQVAKQIFRYLKGNSKHFCILGGITLMCYVMWIQTMGIKIMARAQQDIYLLLDETVVSQYLQLQNSIEAEYMAATEESKEFIWVQEMMNELGFDGFDCILFNDSQSVIHLTKNLAFHSQTKDIHLRYHFIRSFLNW